MQSQADGRGRTPRWTQNPVDATGCGLNSHIRNKELQRFPAVHEPSIAEQLRASIQYQPNTSRMADAPDSKSGLLTGFPTVETARRAGAVISRALSVTSAAGLQPLVGPVKRREAQPRRSASALHVRGDRRAVAVARESGSRRTRPEGPCWPRSPIQCNRECNERAGST